MTRGLIRSLGCVVLVASCSGPSAQPTAPVPQGAVATCAGEPISAISVARLAARRGIPTRDALDLLCRDARLAVAARKKPPDSYAERIGRRSALSRALMKQVQAEQSEPTTQDELNKVRKEHWFELDHPAGVRTVHAVAQASKDDPAAREKAKAVASKILEAVREAKSPDEMMQKASAVEHGDVEVRVEPLPPVGADGVVLGPEASTFDIDFVKGAMTLQKPGEISGLIESSFGFHVVFLVERIAEVRTSDDALREMTRDEIVTNRTKQALGRLLGELRKTTPIEIERSYEQTFSRLDRGTP